MLILEILKGRIYRLATLLQIGELIKYS